MVVKKLFPNFNDASFKQEFNEKFKKIFEDVKKKYIEKEKKENKEKKEIEPEVEKKLKEESEEMVFEAQKEKIFQIINLAKDSNLSAKEKEEQTTNLLGPVGSPQRKEAEQKYRNLIKLQQTGSLQ